MHQKRKMKKEWERMNKGVWRVNEKEKQVEKVWWKDHCQQLKIIYKNVNRLLMMQNNYFIIL